MNAIRKSTTHVVLRERGEKYEVSSQHRSEKAALATCRAIGRNGGQGHAVVVAVAELQRWIDHD